MGLILTGMDGTVRARGMQVHNRVYVTNGRNRPRCFDGVNWTNMGIIGGAALGGSVPNTTPTATAANVGTGVLNGYYNWLIVAVNSQKFNSLGRKVSAIPNPITTPALNLNASNATIANIPATHPDPQVDHWDLYRSLPNGYDGTLPDEGQNYYYVATIPLGTTSYTDSISDNQVKNQETLRFNCNIPPTCKAMALYAERLIFCGFDPLTTGTCSSSGATITFTGVTIPDGVVGCWFQAANDGNKYIIIAQTSNTVTLSTSYVGTLTASAYSIFRQPWEVYGSEQGDVEAWGPDGEGTRYLKELPGRDYAIAPFVFGGRCLIFSTENIYALIGKGQDWDVDISIPTDPVFKGVGAVGPDAIDTVDDEIYFLSLRGMVRIRDGGTPEYIGDKLLTSYLDSLNSTDLSIAAVGCIGRRYVELSVVGTTGDTENSVSFRYDRLMGTWFPFSRVHPFFYYHDTGDGGLLGRTFYAQGNSIFEPNQGNTDVTSQVFSGTLTGATTLSATDLSAAFPTTSGGLVEAYAHFFRTVGGIETYIGSRRIASNTATSVTWNASGVGAGALAIQIGDHYEIGIIWWKWKTRTTETPGHIKKEFFARVTFDHIDPSASLKMTEFIEQSGTGNELAAKTYSQTQPANTLTKEFDLQTRNRNYALLLESRNNARIRQVVVDSESKQGIQ